MTLNSIVNVPAQQAINNLYANDKFINGKTDRGIFNRIEIDDIYAKIGNRSWTREYSLGNTLSTYNSWTHIVSNDGYSIWKYPITDIIDDSNNELYYNDMMLEYRGVGDSEITSTTFTNVFLSNNKKVGTTYISASGADLGSINLANITNVTNAVYASATPSLLYTDIIEGSIYVSSYDTLTNYYEGTDYTVDYVAGTVTLLSGSALYTTVTTSGTNFLITYNAGYSMYIGLSTSTFDGFNITLDRNGLSNKYGYYYSSGSFVYFTDLIDGTNNFSTSGNVSWDSSTLTGWTTSAVNSTTAYWIKIALKSRGSVYPTATSIYKSTSSIQNMLKLSPSDLLLNNYKWAIYASAAYMTIPNSGLTQNEGITYVSQTSSTNVKQNFFVYNNEYISNYRDGIDSNNITLTGNISTSGKIETTNTSSDAIYSKGGVKADGDIYSVGWTDYSNTSTVTGWSITTTKTIKYKKVGKIVFVQYRIEGTSNSDVTRFTLPFDANGFIDFMIVCRDNSGARTPSMGYMNNTTTVHFFTDFNASAPTASGVKEVWGQFWYEAQ